MKESGGNFPLGQLPRFIGFRIKLLYIRMFRKNRQWPDQVIFYYSEIISGWHRNNNARFLYLCKLARHKNESPGISVDPGLSINHDCRSIKPRIDFLSWVLIHSLNKIVLPGCKCWIFIYSVQKNSSIFAGNWKSRLLIFICQIKLQSWITAGRRLFCHSGRYPEIQRVQEAGLTKRKADICAQTKDGMDNDETPSCLFVSVHRLKNRIKSIYKTRR